MSITQLTVDNDHRYDALNETGSNIFDAGTLLTVAMQIRNASDVSDYFWLLLTDEHETVVRSIVTDLLPPGTYYGAIADYLMPAAAVTLHFSTGIGTTVGANTVATNDIVLDVPPTPEKYNVTVTAYRGQAVTDAQKTAFQAVGDFDQSGAIDSVDVQLLFTHYGETPQSPTWNPLCDLNRDNLIDLDDVVLVAANFNRTIFDYLGHPSTALTGQFTVDGELHSLGVTFQLLPGAYTLHAGDRTVPFNVVDGAVSLIIVEYAALPTTRIVFTRTMVQRLYEVALKYNRTRLVNFLQSTFEWKVVAA